MIERIYNNMWDVFQSSILNNMYQLDENIHSAEDSRRGITALAYIDANSLDVSKRISDFLKQIIKPIEPHQYYYPNDEFHVTLLSIISCFTGFQLSDVNSKAYCDVFVEALSETEPLEIEFKGITGSPSCIMIQGFPVGAGIENLRNKLRRAFKLSGLQTSMDTRYTLVTAHSSVIRFCAPIQNPNRLLEICKEYRSYDFGRLVIKDFSLVFNNWYQNLSVTKNLVTYHAGYGKR